MKKNFPGIKYQFIAFWGIAAAALVAAVAQMARLAWVSDDAFISFSYARNLIRGSGLVYNIGERVEGYTNFLWTILISAGMKAGWNPVYFSIVSGIVFAAATIILFSFTSWNHQRSMPGNRFFIPLTALALCAHHEFNVYATGGLETSLATFLVSLLFVILAFGGSRRSYLIAGFVAAVTMLNRPDGVLFVVMSFVYIILTQRGGWRKSIIFLAPVIALYMPYWIWRFGYYGFFFPNTYYAKSIDLPYYEQGWEYFRLYFESYYGFLIFPLLLLVACVRYGKAVWGYFRPRFPVMEIPAEHSWLGPVMLGLLFSFVQIVFTIRIGGDFMFGRFFVVITPILFCIIELLAFNVVQGGFTVIVAGVVVAAIFLRMDMFGTSTSVGYIADEYRLNTLRELTGPKMAGERLHALLAGVPLRVAFGGSQASLIYYLDPELAIEASSGLTDETIAHQALSTRGRPGHEKSPAMNYLMRRKVDLYISFSSSDERPFNKMMIYYTPARILRYNNAVMSRLEGDPGIQFTVVPGVVDQFLAGIAHYPRSAVEKSYAELKPYYFDCTVDTARENRFLEYLRKTSIHGTMSPEPAQKRP